MRYSAARASPRSMCVKYVSSSDLTLDISLRVDEKAKKYKKKKQNEMRQSIHTGPDEPLKSKTASYINININATHANQKCAVKTFLWASVSETVLK